MADKYITTVELNSQQAQDRLKQLIATVDELRRKKDAALSSGKSFLDESQLKKATRELNQWRSQLEGTQGVLNNINDVTLRDLERALRKLRGQRKTLLPDSEDFQKTEHDIARIEQRIDELKNSAKAAKVEVAEMTTDLRNLKTVMSDINGASLNQLRGAQSYLESQVSGLSPKSTSYSTAVAQLQQVRTRIQEINAEQTRLVTTIDRYDREIREAHGNMAVLRRETQLVNNTLSHLNSSSVREIEYSIKILNEQMRGMKRGTREFELMTEKAKLLRTELNKIRFEGAAQQSWINRTADWFNRMQGVAFSAIATITGVSMTVHKCTSEYAQMDEEMTNVIKYTGQTKEEVKAMNEEFKDLDTRTSREKLNQLAGDAGRLGITTHDAVMEFVDGADKINVALGDDLGDDAVKQIGKLTQMFGEDKTKGLRGGMLATGSAVNELSQNSSASAGYLVDFTARVAGVGKQANMTQTQIMGLASVLDQNMQQDETAATAVQNFLTKMFQEPAKFAKIAGKDVKEFTDLIKTDANAALLQFLESMKAKGGFASLAPMFEDMNMDGSRATGVLSVLADKVDDVKKAQELANNAYNDGTSILTEFNTQMQSEQAKIDIAAKSFKDLRIELGEKLMPVARYGIRTGGLLVEVLLSLINFVSKYRVTLIALTATITALIVVENISIGLKKLHVFWNEKIVASSKRLWAILVAHPYAAVFTAIVAVIGVMIDLNRKTKELTVTQKAMAEADKRATESVASEKTRLEQLRKIVLDSSKSLKERNGAIQEIQKVVPEYIANIDKEGKAYEENTTKLDEYLKKLKQKALLEGAKDVLGELGKRKAELQMQEIKQQKEVDEWQKQVDNSKHTYVSSPSAFLPVSNPNTMYLDNAKDKLNDIKNKLTETNDAIDTLSDKFGTDLFAAETKEDKGGGGGDGSYVSDEKKEKQRKERMRRMREEVKQAKAITAEEQANNISMYAQGEQSYRDFLANKHDIAIKGYNALISIYQKYGEEYRQLTDDIANEHLKADEDKTKLDVKDIEANRLAVETALLASYEDVNSEIYLNEDALNEALFENDMSAMADRLSLYKVGTEEWFDIKNEMEQKEREHQLELEMIFQERLANIREQFGGADITRQETIALKGLDELYKKKLIKDSEYQDTKRKMELYYAELQSEVAVKSSTGAITRENASSAYDTAHNNAVAESDNTGGTSLGSFLFGDIQIYSSTMEQLRSMYEDDRITYEEYQLAKSQATGTFLSGLVEKTQAAYEQISTVMSAMSNYYSAQSQYEQNVTTQKYDKLIEKAGNNSAKTKKLEEQKEKELAKIKTKYNKKAMKIQIAQAIATNAISALNAYASVYAGVPWPANQILAPIAAGIALAAGALQIATIKKQHQAEEAGYYSGGYTGGSQYRREAGVVHQGEFVANHHAVNNPALVPVLDFIDRAQRNNTVANIRPEDVTRQLGGGASAVITPVVNVNTDNSDIGDTISALNEAVDSLNGLLAAGIRSTVAIDGPDGVYKQLKHFERLKKNA